MTSSGTSMQQYRITISTAKQAAQTSPLHLVWSLIQSSLFCLTNPPIVPLMMLFFRGNPGLSCWLDPLCLPPLQRGESGECETLHCRSGLMPHHTLFINCDSAVYGNEFNKVYLGHQPIVLLYCDLNNDHGHAFIAYKTTAPHPPFCPRYTLVYSSG